MFFRGGGSHELNYHMINRPVEISCPEEIDGVGIRDLVVPSHIVLNGDVVEVTGIGKGAFSNCGSVVSLRLTESLLAVREKAFLGCRNLLTVVFGESTEVIGDSAFSGCVSLSALKFGPSLKSIGKYAFWGCESIESISLSPMVQEIGRCCFAGCDSLKDIYCSGEPPHCDLWSFGFSDDVFRRATLHVPAGTSGKYAMSPVWHRFSRIEEMTPEFPGSDGCATGKPISADMSGREDERLMIFDASGNCVYRGAERLVDFLPPGSYTMVIGDKMMKIDIK